MNLLDEPMPAGTDERVELLPLERFLRDYVDCIAGAWEDVEPQVYDLLLPEGRAGMLRITFDPEAIGEHPGSQLATLGSPLVDGMLADAMRRGARSRAHVQGVSLRAQDVPARLGRAIAVPDGHSLKIERVRAMCCANAIYWFSATFISDQKEDQSVMVGIDLHYGRQVRHLDQLLDPARLAETAARVLPEAPRLSAAAALATARQQAARTVGAMANARIRDLESRLQRQAARMTRYYADLRQELAQQEQREHDPVRLEQRRQTLQREEALRLAELRGKSAMRVRMRLTNLLLVHQPKLLTSVRIAGKWGLSQPVGIVWDPLTETIEAAACAGCGASTYQLAMDRDGAVLCPGCVASRQPGRARGR